MANALARRAQINEALSSGSMNTGPRDVAQIRLDNALALFEEFVRNTVKDPDAATMWGLERRFAERLQIQPSYWSQIKSRSRQIGERLARQFEHLCHKPVGWMDLPHDIAVKGAPPPAPASRAAAPGPAGSPVPQDDDERFIVGLVLTYYRRHPQRARSRLLGLLGEVLTPPEDQANVVPVAAPLPLAPPRPLAPGVTRRPAVPPAQPQADDDLALWARARAAIAPLKGSRKPKA